MSSLIVRANFDDNISLRLRSITTGLSTIIDVFYLRLRNIKDPKSNFKPVHFALYFGNFTILVLKLILASKLSELEEFKISGSK